jgi:hypothetical protein
MLGAQYVSQTMSSDLNPAYTNAYFNRGVAYHYLGEYQRAI